MKAMKALSRLVLIAVIPLSFIGCSAQSPSQSSPQSSQKTSSPATASVNGESGTSINLATAKAYETFQANADVIRLRHLRHWVGLIEDYHARTGKYPYQGMTKHPIYVFVATPRQQEGKSLSPPAPATTKSMADFVATLESGLGQTVDEYYDPQYAADAKPNFYMYMIDGDNYYFAIHTHQRYPFSKFVAPNYHKVEVSNLHNPSVNLVVTPELLLSSEPFLEAVNQPVKNLSFFTNRAQKDLHASKQLTAD